jgi:hypothetical protein
MGNPEVRVPHVDMMQAHPNEKKPMNKSWLAAALALSVAAYSQLGVAQIINSTATGGAGGRGGSASGGSATGGSSSNSNTVNSSGGTGGSATGGTTTSKGGSASGGAASAEGGTVTGVSTGSINSTGTGNSQAAEVTVNYITPSAPGGIKGLAAGVDPETNHYVNDNNVRYSGSQTIKNTPDVSVGGPASGPCNGFSAGIGVSVPGFAVGANTSTVDKGCEARETARIAAMLGRMDIANAVLEHISVVEEALKAKADREAAKQAAMAVPAAPAKAASVPQQQQQQQKQQQPPTETELETARLAEQQKLAVAALQRKATMDKVNDTITFTTAANQEKTPQQTMAEEATQKQAELAARIQKQEAEQQQTALKSVPVDKPSATLASQGPSNGAAPPVPVAAAVGSPAPTAVPSASAANAAIAQQASGNDKPQMTKSSASLGSTTNGAPATAPTASVAAAQPSVSADQLSNLLGFSASAAPAAMSSTAPSPATSDDGFRKIASKAAVAPAAKADTPSPQGGGNPATKSQPSDPVGVAKSLLNFR